MSVTDPPVLRASADEFLPFGRCCRLRRLPFAGFRHRRRLRLRGCRLRLWRIGFKLAVLEPSMARSAMRMTRWSTA